jgi:AcrR family transcriptional regulator
VGRSPKLPPSDLKAAILAAARARFAMEGFEATSMRRIAEDAGCSATAIYLYFEDKQRLMDALVLEDFLAIAQGFQKLRSVKDPLERIRRAGRQFTAFAVQHPNHYRLLFMTPKPDLAPPVDGRGRDTAGTNPYLFVRSCLEEARDAGCFRPGLDDADLMAQTILAAVHGVLAFHVVQYRDRWIQWRPLQARAEFVLDAVIESFRA